MRQFISIVTHLFILFHLYHPNQVSKGLTMILLPIFLHTIFSSTNSVNWVCSWVRLQDGCEDTWRWFSPPFGPDLSLPLWRLHRVSFSSTEKAFLTIIPVFHRHGNTLCYVILYFSFISSTRAERPTSPRCPLGQRDKRCVQIEWLLEVWLYRFLDDWSNVSAAGSVKQMWGTNGLARRPSLLVEAVVHWPSNQSRHESNCHGLTDHQAGT